MCVRAAAVVARRRSPAFAQRRPGPLAALLFLILPVLTVLDVQQHRALAHELGRGAWCRRRMPRAAAAAVAEADEVKEEPKKKAASGITVKL